MTKEEIVDRVESVLAGEETVEEFCDWFGEHAWARIDDSPDVRVLIYRVKQAIGDHRGIGLVNELFDITRK